MYISDILTVMLEAYNVHCRLATDYSYHKYGATIPLYHTPITMSEPLITNEKTLLKLGTASNLRHVDVTL